MQALRSVLGGIADSFTPDGTLIRARMRTRLEALTTTGITALAVALAIGYQLVRRMPESWRLALRGGDDDRQE